MKMGIGIGWPNSTSSWGDIYSFTIKNCDGKTVIVYSESPEFLPGAYIFLDPEGIEPFESNILWNYPGLIYSIGGYEVLTGGQVKNSLETCPI